MRRGAEAGSRIFGRRVIYHGRPEVSLKKSSRKGAKVQSFQRIIDAIEEIRSSALLPSSSFAA